MRRSLGRLIYEPICGFEYCEILKSALRESVCRGQTSHSRADDHDGRLRIARVQHTGIQLACVEFRDFRTWRNFLSGSTASGARRRRQPSTICKMYISNSAVAPCTALDFLLLFFNESYPNQSLSFILKLTLKVIKRRIVTF